MRILNLNPGDDVGASAWRVEIGGHRLLLDAGTHPKREGKHSLPLYRKVRGEDVDAIAVTHCHHDHVGSLPVAMRHFPLAHVLMTEQSYFIIERVLHNSVNVMTRQRDELGIAEYPLFTHEQLDELAARFQGFRYNREIEWAAHHRPRSATESPTLEFFDAGHTLGSAGVLVRSRQESLFYTSDVSFGEQTLLKGARYQDVHCDILLMETTRGLRELPPGFSREQQVERLLQSIQRVLKRKGSVLIPAFALGRTQEILAMLALAMRQGRLKRQPVYVGGLGRVFTEIYDLEAHRTHRHHSHLLLHEALDLQVHDMAQLERMRLTGGKIFVLTSGMMSENTAAWRMALRLMGDERHAVFFVGYADPDTPGGRFKVSKAGAPFAFSATGEPVIRRCEMEDFDLTAHANREELLGFVKEVRPKVVVLGHGGPEARQWFAEQLAKRHPRIKVLQPGPGESVTT